MSTRTSMLSPQIQHVSWGHMEVEGVGAGKDFKLYPGGGRPWDWRETGTEHVPGIQPSDIEELLDHGARVVVLSKGMQEKLHVSKESLRMLEERRVTVHIEETRKAVEIYNDLAKRERVGGLFHSTC